MPPHWPRSVCRSSSGNCREGRRWLGHSPQDGESFCCAHTGTQGFSDCGSFSAVRQLAGGYHEIGRMVNRYFPRAEGGGSGELRAAGRIHRQLLARQEAAPSDQQLRKPLIVAFVIIQRHANEPQLYGNCSRISRLHQCLARFALGAFPRMKVFDGDIKRGGAAIRASGLHEAAFIVPAQCYERMNAWISRRRPVPRLAVRDGRIVCLLY